MRKFYFYHIDKKKFHHDKNITYVWLPYTKESEQMIMHIKKNFPEANYSIESSLTELFQGDPKRVAPVSKQNKKIFLYAQSDTLATSISIVGEGLNLHQVVYLIPQNSMEKADAFFISRNIEYNIYSFSFLKSENPDIFILLNDWSKEAQRIITHCHLLRIPVICIQESVIDFGDHFKRMQRADEVFVQGVQTVIDLKRSSYHITGNPRYEQISRQSTPGHQVLINCNFTYGIFENKREGWLNDIHEVLHRHNLDYTISQHPRDKGDLSKYKKVISSSSGSVTQQLESAKFLVTRFSSLIHESLVMGVPVIYYNPHGEKMGYNFEFDDKVLLLAKTKSELELCVEKLENVSVDNAYLEEYLARHCICRSSLPSKNIEFIISNFNFKPGRIHLADYLKMFIYHPTIKAGLSKIRKTIKVNKSPMCI